MSAVQLHTLSVDLAASLTDTMTNPSPSTPRSWHAVTFPTYAAVRRTITDHSSCTAQMPPETAVKSLPLRSLPSLPPPPLSLSLSTSSSVTPTTGATPTPTITATATPAPAPAPAPAAPTHAPALSTEARAASWRSIDRADDPHRALRPRPRSARHHSSADAALPRPKPTRPTPSPNASFTSTPSISLNSAPIRRRFADREDAPAVDENPVVRAASSMPARAFCARNTRWDDTKRTPTAAGTGAAVASNSGCPINRKLKPCSLNNIGMGAGGMGRVPRSAGGDGEDCPAVNAFVAERQVRTEGPQMFRRVELVRPVATRDRDDSRTDSGPFSDTSFRRGEHRSPPRRLQAPIAVKAKASPASSGVVTSAPSSASSSRESSIGYGRLGAKTGVTSTLPSVGDLVGDDDAPPLGLAGTLGKRGRLTNRLVQRHFVLEGALLSNYRTREDVKPSWQKNIQGAHVIAKERSHQIIVAIGKKRVILYASSGEDTRDWADALGRAAYGGADTEARGYRYGGDVDVDVGVSSTGDRSWSTRLHSSKLAPSSDRSAMDNDWATYSLGLDRSRLDDQRRRQSELRGMRHRELDSNLFKNNRISSNRNAAAFGNANTTSTNLGSHAVHVGSA